MKKIILLFVVVVFSMTQLSAQKSTFGLGDKVLNLGIGFGSGLYSGPGNTSSIPPLSASFEVGVKDNVIEKGSIGVGGFVGYTAYKWENMSWGYKYTNLIIGARGAFHYPLLEQLDTYTGLTLGYNFVSAKEFGAAGTFPYNKSGSGLSFAWFVGGRYYFNEKFGAMAELGVGITYLNLGVSMKF